MNPRRIIARLTIRKTVQVVSTLDVYESTPPVPVHRTTGVESRDSELPPSVPSMRKAQPVDLHVVRKIA